jgi:chromosomal replication initiator protein
MPTLPASHDALQPHPGTSADAASSEAAPAVALDQIWPLCLTQLQSQLPEQQYNTWIRPLPLAEARLEDSEDGSGPALVLDLKVPNRFILDWIRRQYSSRIETIAAEVAHCPARLDISQQQRSQPTGASHAMLNGQAPQRLGQVLGHAMSSGAPTHSEPQGHNGAFHPTGFQPGYRVADAAPQRPAVVGLNLALTFDNLVPGRANQMARTAALHVAGAPGVAYNPLFIYGGVGLGKTHLLNAVGNALLADKPNARILYLHAEQFISDVVKNYQRKTFDELKAKYHSLDLLLIDDVQFFAGKDRTQEEFFNTFEALLAKKAHIIMTSDTYPKGLANIDERLTSRFDAGLTVAIEPPELEMRVAILIKKATQEGVVMPEDVAFFVAKNVRANVRELEGALRKILAFSRFSHKEITITLARESLKDLLTYKIKVADMYSKKRPASIARPRQIAMYLAKELTQKSLPEIGELFGGRDHTTVLHAVRKINGERGKDTELNQQLHVLEQTLKG